MLLKAFAKSFRQAFFPEQLQTTDSTNGAATLMQLNNSLFGIFL